MVELPSDVAFKLLNEHAEHVASKAWSGAPGMSGFVWVWKVDDYYLKYDDTWDEMVWKFAHGVSSVAELLREWELTEISSATRWLSAAMDTDELLDMLYPSFEECGEWVIEINGVPVRFPDKIRVSEEKDLG